MNDNQYSMEQVTHIPSPLNNGQCIPRIMTKKDPKEPTSSTEARPSSASHAATLRPFRTQDFARILDYDALQTPPPPDALLGHLELQLEEDPNEDDEEGQERKGY